MDSHPVVHIVAVPLLGHHMSPDSRNAHDCWCEPSEIYWTVNKWGVKILIVEHHDFSEKHRAIQLSEQAAGIPAALAWINHALYDPDHYPSAPHREWRGRKDPS